MKRLNTDSKTPIGAFLRTSNFVSWKKCGLSSSCGREAGKLFVGHEVLIVNVNDERWKHVQQLVMDFVGAINTNRSLLNKITSTRL